MSVRLPSRLFSMCVMLWCCVTASQAQDTKPAPAEGQAELPIIVDEPRTVDPATFVPTQLADVATADFSDSSLREVVHWLRDQQNLVVLLENQALSGIGVSPGDPVSDRLDETPIYLLLNRLRSLNLGWYYEDDVLHVTSAESAAERLSTVPYRIGDLFDAGYEEDSLALLIVDAVAPGSWSDVGGEGVLSFLGDVMLVRQTHALHREVRGLLAALRNHGRRTFTLDPPKHLELRQKLTENVAVSFRETPLQAAVERLAETAQIDIRLDLPALRADGIRQREPITLSLDNRKLKTVLQAMLIDLELTWVLRDGVLWITNHGEAGQTLKTAVYDVRDLCRDDAESEALQEAIISQTDPVWDEVGGDATLRFARPGAMVLHGTEKTHNAVLDLLETYRTAFRSSKPRARDKEDPNEVVTVYYRMHTNMAQDLSMLLPHWVRPGSWISEAHPEAPGQVMRVASAPELSKLDAELSRAPETKQMARLLVTERAVLIIRQTRAAQEEIEEVIRRVESGDTRPSDGMMGGMGGAGFGGGFFNAQ